jgi:hypothetical protein
MPSARIVTVAPSEGEGATPLAHVASARKSGDDMSQQVIAVSLTSSTTAGGLSIAATAEMARQLSASSQPIG